MTRAQLIAANSLSLAALPADGDTPIVVVLPAFNEAENLPFVLRRAPQAVGGVAVRCLVADDGSTDGTAEVALACGALVVRASENGGGGRALRLGYLGAERLGARIVVTMDADGQHDFANLDALVGPVLDGRADFVIGSRRLGNQVGGDTARSLGVSVFNGVLTAVTRQRITDCASGFRAFRSEPLARLNLVQDRHHTAETIIEAKRKGLRIAEVPITIHPRHAGASKKGTTWKYALRFARTVVVTTIRRG